MHKYKIRNCWLGKNTGEEELVYHKQCMNQQHVTVAHLISGVT